MVTLFTIFPDKMVVIASGVSVVQLGMSCTAWFWCSRLAVVDWSKEQILTSTLNLSLSRLWTWICNIVVEFRLNFAKDIIIAFLFETMAVKRSYYEAFDDTLPDQEVASPTSTLNEWSDADQQLAMTHFRRTMSDELVVASFTWMDRYLGRFDFYKFVKCLRGVCSSTNTEDMKRQFCELANRDKHRYLDVNMDIRLALWDRHRSLEENSLEWFPATADFLGNANLGGSWLGYIFAWTHFKSVVQAIKMNSLSMTFSHKFASRSPSDSFFLL